MVENILGTEENAGYQHFLLFPKCFQKLYSSGSLKVEIVLERVNPLPNKSLFLHVCNTYLLETLGKGEVARNEQFLLFPQCFLPLLENCLPF